MNLLVEDAGAVRPRQLDDRVGEGHAVAADLVDVDVEAAAGDLVPQRRKCLEGANGDARGVDADGKARAVSRCETAASRVLPGPGLR